MVYLRLTVLCLIAVVYSCAPSLREASFTESTWSGSWNSADAEGVVLDLFQELKVLAPDTNHHYVLGAVKSASPELNAATLADALAVRCDHSPVVKDKSYRIETILKQLEPFRYPIDFMIYDAQGNLMWQIERRVEKSPR